MRATGLYDGLGAFISLRKVTAWHMKCKRGCITPEDTYLKAKWFRFDQHAPQELAAVTIEKLSDPALWPSLSVTLPLPGKLKLPGRNEPRITQRRMMR